MSHIMIQLLLKVQFLQQVMNQNHRPANFMMAFLPQNGQPQYTQNVPQFNQSFSHSQGMMQPPMIPRQPEQRFENYPPSIRPTTPLVQNRNMASPTNKQTHHQQKQTKQSKQSIQSITQNLMVEMTKSISELTKAQVDKILEQKQAQEKTKREQKKQEMKKYSKSKNQDKSQVQSSGKRLYNRHASMQTPINETKQLERYDGEQMFLPELEVFFNKVISREKSQIRDYLSTTWRQSRDHPYSVRESQSGETLVQSMKQLIKQVKKLTENKKQNRSIGSTVEFSEYPIDDKKRIAFLKQNVSKILSQILSVSFNMYYKDGMDFEKVKSYCCQNMLINFCSLANLMKIDRKDMKILEQHLQQDVLPFLNLSYPRSQQKFFNKQLKGKIDEKDIFNQNRFDIVYNSKVQMSTKQKQTNAEIMKIMNYIISLPDSYPQGKEGANLNLSTSYITQNQQKTLYELFVEDMSGIFTRTYKKDLSSKLTKFFRIDRFAIRDSIMAKKQKFATSKELMQIIDKQILLYCQEFQIKNSQPNHYRIEYHIKQKEEQEYKQKVLSYTKMKIGRKISSYVQPFTEEEIQEGALKIKDSSIARVLMKWVEALQNQITNPTKATYARGEPFRLNNQDETYFLSRQAQIHKLWKLYERSSSVVRQKSQILKNNARQIFLQALKSSQLTKFKSYKTFSSQNQAKIGHICTLIQKCKQNHISSYLNMLLGEIKCIEQEYQWLIEDKTTTLYSRPSLITMKLGDLMRCQITSKPKQIIALYEYICLVCKCDPSRFQMVRIKDRSNTTNKDILINIFYYKKVMIQIQLAIKNQSTFISCSDMFSHFIYELNRAFLGPINEMCSIWSHFSPKAQFFNQKFLQINVKAQQIFLPKCYQQNIKHDYEDERKGFKLPFWCSTCGVLFYNDSINRTICKKCGKYKCDMCNVRESIDQYIRQNYPRFQILKAAPELGKIYYALDIGTNHRHIKGLMIMEINGKTEAYSMKIEPKPNKDEKTEILLNKPIVITNIEAEFEVSKRKIRQNMKKQLFDQQHIILKKKNLTLLDKNFEQKLQQSIHESIIRDYYLPSVIKNITKKSQKYLKISLITNPIISPDIKGQLVSKILMKNQGSLEYIQKLSLNQNGLKDLRIAGLMPLVRAIALYHNGLSVLKLSGFRNLVSLELSQNKIQSFHQLQSLFQCTNIVRIYLDENQIQSLEGFPSQLRKLQVLSLRKNRISNIKDIPRLLSLRCLNLNENRVSSLNGLENVEILHQLRLKGNTFLGSQGIQHIKQLKQLKKLDLSSTNTSKNMFLSITKTVAGKFQQILIERPLDPKLQVLIVLNGLTFMQQLDISENGLKSIPHLPKLVHLKELNLFKNYLTSVKNIQNFSSLTWLSLKYNQITSLKGLRKLTNLKWLDLSANEIEYEELSQLSYLSELHQLSLNENPLTSLEGIGNLKMLHQLNAKGNRIQSLIGVRKLTSLEHLDVISNQIKQLKGIENLKLLVDLKLSRNPIKNLQLLEKVQNLKILQLNSINLEQISSIPRLKNLQELYINHNKLQSLKGIQNFQSLKKLEIKYNNIKNLQGLKKLKFLSYLSFSLHPSIDLNSIKQGQSLTILSIQKTKQPTEQQQQILIAFILIGYDIQFASDENQ